MLKYSIVVPVYNIKEYLKDCLDSVLGQSVCDYEVILVNDGSTDGSGELCDTYAAKYPQIHVVHQLNQGVAVARNTGIQKASGMYVLLLDSDDWWELNLLELLEPLTEKSPDIIEFGYKKVYTGGQTECVYPTLTANGESGSQYLLQIFENCAMPIGSSCTCAYRRQFLLDHNLFYTAGIRYGEDLKFRLQVLQNAASIYSLPETLYLYRMRESSVTHRISPQSFNDVLSVAAEIATNHPCPATANHYCMKLLSVVSLSRKEAKTLKPLYQKNRHLLKSATGTHPRIARFLFSVFGWYSGARLVRFFVSVKQRLKLSFSITE